MSRVLCLLLIALSFPCLGQEETPQRSVFDLPSLISQHARLQSRIQQLLRAKDYRTAAVNCRDAMQLFPDEPINYYNLACCQSRLGRTEDALASLERAIDRGFNNAQHIQQDADLAGLRKTAEFAALLKRAPTAKRIKSAFLNRTTTPTPIKDGVAMVSEKNTKWNAKLGVFQPSFKFESSPRPPTVTKHRTRVAKQVYDWYIGGSAAGLENHLYDNHDGDHSNMRYKYFPQLNLIEFSDDIKKRRLNRGLQTRYFYNGITIGNSSTAWTSGPYWRSQPRMAYTSPRFISMLYLQYTQNHIYVYPEHRDHDIKMGDVFPCNTPYVLISQGSSGSDRTFLEAIAWGLASFQPKAKEKLAKRGALMAALQMVFRRSNKRVVSDEDYLTGRAHPTVFDGSTIDEWRLINLAHQIRPGKVPPVVRLQASEEDEPVLGVDYFDDRPRVKMFDTPSAISRVLKSTKRTYRMVVSAEQSFDLNDRDLTYHWRVLRGDEKQIRIKPLNKEKSIVEIIVPYQTLRPVSPGSDLKSSRVDVGAFVHNGAYYSAPAFVSFHSPRNETRKYNEHGNIESVEYQPFGKTYADPFLTIPREWTDRYQYDSQQRLIGWTRTRPKTVEHFTAAGALVLKKDDKGRALQARTVNYRFSTDPRRKPPVLEQHPGSEILHYEYRSPADKVGRIVRRTPAT